MTIPSRAAYQVTSDTDPPRYAPGYWYMIAPTTALSAAGGTLTQNAIRATPWMVRSRVRIQSLGVRVTTGVAGLMQLAVYRANASTLNPMGVPLANTGDIDTTTAQNVNGAPVQGIVTLGPGLHWFCYVINAASGLQGVPVASPFSGVIWGGLTQAIVSASATAGLGFKGSTLTYGSPWPDGSLATWNDVAGQQAALGQFQVAV